jgi:peptidoglycan/LPS O-acetylase OafA/YrhL
LFREQIATRAFRARRFLVRRAFKIWPILYLFLFVQTAFGFHPLSTFLIQNALHVQNFWVSSLSHLWSLAVEEHFYLAFALGFSYLASNPSHVRKIPYFLGAIAVAALLLRVTAISAGIESDSIQIQTQFRIDALACGVALAYVQAYHPAHFESLASRKFILAAVWLSVATFLANNSFHSEIVQSVGYSLTFLGAAAFLLFCHRNKLVISAKWPVRIVAGIGIYSYAMYIYQFVCERPVEALTARLHFSDSAATLFMLAGLYAGAVLVAVVVTKAIERPFLALREWLLPAGAKPITRSPTVSPANNRAEIVEIYEGSPDLAPRYPEAD